MAYQVVNGPVTVTLPWIWRNSSDPENGDQLGVREWSLASFCTKL